jgi:glycosyltransferase involved in cell wall biosynthesis
LEKKKSLTALVSVIVPTYNQAKYLKYALDSVQRQTFKDFECIIVNDGSTDNTEEIANIFVLSDKRFKYVFQENSGLSAARNAGIAISKGEYLAFLDSDDTWEPRMLQETVNVLNTHLELSIVYGACDLIDEFGVVISKKISPGPRKNYVADLAISCIFVVNSALTRKLVFLEVGLFDTNLKASEDWDFWLRAADNGYKFGFVDKLVCHYRRYTNAMSCDIERMRIGAFLLLEKFYSRQHSLEIAKLKPYSFIFRWLKAAEHWNELGNFSETQKCLREAEQLYREVYYIKKHSKRLEEILEGYLPYSITFLNRIYYFKPLLRKFEEPSIRFKRKANYCKKRSFVWFWYEFFSLILWPPSIIGYFTNAFLKFLY